jgi:1-acyl-sn-glycerol-3-phosphate acyltransferase
MQRWELEPARDHGLSPRQRLASLQREAGLVGALAHLGWWLASRCYLAAFHRFTVTGRENLPEAPPYILVANHTSHLDAVSLAASLPAPLCNRTFPIAAGDTFFERLPVSIFAALAINALPLWRRHAQPADLAALRERLVTQRCIYILFPEGTRARDGVMSRFKPGLGRLVAGTQIPVVPCHIDGAFRALPPDRKLPRRQRVVIHIGRPLVFAKASDDKAGWLEVAAAAEAAVQALATAAKVQPAV